MALEGALKLKEVSYIHAEGYGAGEMKHGPIAMIDENFPTIAIAPIDSVYEKTLSNIEEIRSRQGKVIVITTKGNEKIKDIANDWLYIPNKLRDSWIASEHPLFTKHVPVKTGNDRGTFPKVVFTSPPLGAWRSRNKTFSLAMGILKSPHPSFPYSFTNHCCLRKVSITWLISSEGILNT